MRPIDADALIEDVNKVKYFRKIQARRIIDAQPTVDAVPVDWITRYMNHADITSVVRIRLMLDVWREEQHESD